MILELRLDIIIDTILTTLTAGAIGFIIKFIKFQKEQQKRVGEAMKSTLRYSIVRAHGEYMKDKEISRWALDAVGEMYAEYRSMDGNGFVDKLVDDLRGLPLSDI